MAKKRPVAELLVDLQHPRDWRVRQEAVIQLARHKTPEAMQALISALYDENPHVMHRAATELDDFGKAAVPGLLEALYSPREVQTRYYILHRLSTIGEPGLTHHCIHFLADSDERMRSAAAKALTKDPDKRAIPALLRALENACDNEAKTEILEALAGAGETDLVPYLQPLLYDEPYGVGYAAARLLGQIHTPEALVLLLEASRIEQDYVRECAAVGLGAFNDDAVFQRLTEMVTDSTAMVRVRAVHALGDMRHPQVVPLLLTLSKSDDAHTRLSALRALPGTGDLRAVLPVLNRYREDSTNSRGEPAELAEAFWRYRKRSTKILPDVLRALQSDDMRLQICALLLFPGASYDYVRSRKNALTKFQLEHLDVFLKLLGHEHADVRLAAVLSITSDAVEPALEALLVRLEDDDAQVARCAVQCLGTCRSDVSMNALIETTRSPRDDVRREAVQALNYMHLPQALDVFIALLDHDDEWTRSTASAALGRLKGERAAKALIARLERETNDHVRGRLMMDLSQTGYQAAAAKIAPTLANEDDKVFTESPTDMALIALNMTGSDESLEALYKTLNESPRWQRRMFAVDALARIGSEPEIAGRMFDLLTHDNDTVRTTAAKALGFLGAKTADLDLRDVIVTRLIACLDDKEAGYHATPSVAHMVAKSLYYIGTPEAIAARNAAKIKLIGEV